MLNLLSRELRRLVQGRQVGDGFLLVSLFSSFIFFNYLVFWRLNPVQIDLGGHIASARAFADGLFHSFNPRFFQGTIQNLFYPPLEDFLLAIITTFTRGVVHSNGYAAHILGLQIYLMLLSAGLHWTWYRVGKLAFPRTESRFAFVMLSLVFFWADKYGSLRLQGFSAIDILSIGLSSQTLSLIPLIWLLRELSQRRRWSRVAALLFFILIAHLVTAIGAVAICLVLWLAEKEKKEASKALICAFGASAFFILPFVWYGSYRVQSEVIFPQAAELPVVCAALWIWALVRKSRYDVYSLSLALLIFAAIAYAFAAKERGWPFLPLHYYRFEGVSLVLMLFSGARLVSRDGFGNGGNALKPRVFAAVVLALVSISSIYFFRPFRNLNSWFHASPGRFTEVSRLNPEAPPGTRTLVLSENRPIDFGIESFLSLSDPGFRGVKGLYWESARANLIVNSYLANVLDFRVILPALVHFDSQCYVVKCMLDQMIREHAITTLVTNRVALTKNRATWIKSCLPQVLDRLSTDRYKLRELSSIKSGEQIYQVYAINPMSVQNQRFQSLVEVIPENSIRAVSEEKVKSSIFSDLIDDRQASCQVARPEITHFLEASERSKFDQLRGGGEIVGQSSSQPPINDFAPVLQEISPSLFRVILPETHAVWATIKMAPLPGWKWQDSAGRDWPLLRGVSSLVVQGQGEMWLEYKRPALFWMSYGISIVTLVGLFVRGRERFRKR